jgi:predicted amidophosphoribosyltransferase
MAFACRRPLPAPEIALVDDVMTTGATAAAAAQALRAAGARRVELWVVARVVREA